jgi:hypothetical protein
MDNNIKSSCDYVTPISNYSIIDSTSYVIGSGYLTLEIPDYYSLCATPIASYCTSSSLTYQSTLSDGSALPSYIKFFSSNMSFVVYADEDLVNTNITYNIIMYAFDSANTSLYD